MKVNFIKLVGLFSMVVLSACYNDCTDFEAEESPTIKFQVMKDSSEVIDSLVEIVYHGETDHSMILTENQVAFQLDVPPAIKNKTVFEDSLFIFYDDTLRSTMKVNITKTKGTCFSVYKLSEVIIDDSTFCTSNCASVVYEVSL